MHRTLSVLLALAALPAAAQSLSTFRTYEPVVLEGRQLPILLGATPERVVGYRLNNGGAWVRFPLQIDERRADVDVGYAYDPDLLANPDRCPYTDPDTGLNERCTELTGHAVLPYYWTDPGTYIGADPDSTFDDDDELVFMARDAGAPRTADTADPTGATPGTRVEVRLRASDASAPVYVYLFVWGALPDSIEGYVDYDPVFCDPDDYPDTCRPIGSYLNRYNFAGLRDGDGVSNNRAGANPEDTAFTSDHYALHFKDRWILDGLHLGGSVDLVDRHKLARPNLTDEVCARTEWTASMAEGAFVVNRAGPIRAIRSVIGFNSGPLSQRHYVLYDRYFEQRVFQRVHQVGPSGLTDFFDYSDAVTFQAFRYTNNLIFEDPGIGWTAIDGGLDDDPDVSNRGELTWEAVRGTPGTIVTRFDVRYEQLDLTTQPPVPIPATLASTNYYEDDVEPTASVQCTGDDDALGASGPQNDGVIPNTDPRPHVVEDTGELYRLELGRRTVLRTEHLANDEVEAVLAFLDDPVEVTVNPGVLTGDDPGTPPPAAGDRLLPPRPNPAAGPSVVPFELAAGGAVRVAVYDLLGREVAVLAAGLLHAGPHEAVLDGSGLPAGVYVVRLTTPEGSHALKVTLGRGGPQGPR